MQALAEIVDGGLVDGDEHRLLRESARSFAARSLRPHRLRIHRDAGSEFERRIWREMAELGWTGIAIPADLGGCGLGLAEATIVLEELGERLLPEPLVAAALLPGHILSHARETQIRDKLILGIVSGSIVLALAWQSGPDPFRLGEPVARIEPADGQIRLRGRVSHVIPAGADGYIVAAQGAAGQGLYWVEAVTPGITAVMRSRADGGRVANLSLDVLIPAACELIAPGEAEQALAAALDFATIATSAELLGLIRGALRMTIEYLKTRKQFDRTIGSFQALQHRAADIFLEQELCAAALADVLREVTADQDARRRARAASRIKARTSEAALRVTREAIQLHGGIGFTQEHDIGLYLKRALVLSSWLGNGAQHVRRFSDLSTAPSSDLVRS